jgi:hypothetical protein
MPMFRGFRSKERIGDLANSTAIRRKQRNTGIYPGSAPSKGKRPTSCLSDSCIDEVDVMKVLQWWSRLDLAESRGLEVVERSGVRWV